MRNAFALKLSVRRVGLNEACWGENTCWESHSVVFLSSFNTLSGQCPEAASPSCRKNKNHTGGDLQAAFTGNNNPLKALSERCSPHSWRILKNPPLHLLYIFTLQFQFPYNRYLLELFKWESFTWFISSDKRNQLADFWQAYSTKEMSLRWVLREEVYQPLEISTCWSRLIKAWWKPR